ncbi:MAG: Coenzyme F420 hydrogenase/dehydrogenase, beta subunit C-terminal domain [Candidatus Bathyarchaeia archaeon]
MEDITISKFSTQNIESIVARGLCTGCGTCFAICPNSAICITLNHKKEIFLPKVDTTKCTQCSLCHQVCPGDSVNFIQLAKNDAKQLKQSDNVLLGNYVDCYVGYSTDCTVRFNSSSGGIVSQLLISALEDGLVDGALITRMDKNKPLKPEPFIACTRQEILDAAKSKYCPVPVNIALKKILSTDGKFAYVGLPCHIHGLRKAQKINEKLRRRIVLTIGVFCSHNDSFGSTRYMLQRLKVPPFDVAAINYRGQGWPGVFNVKRKSGGSVECSFSDWIRVHEYCFFTPDRCLLCCDHTAELADLSVGDSWLPAFYKDHNGTSIFISRNSIGEKFLQLAQGKGQIKCSSITSKSVVKSQGNVRFKKNGISVRSFIFRTQKKSVPRYDVPLPESELVEIPRSIIIFVNRLLASKLYSSQNIDRLISIQLVLKKLYATSTSSVH